MADIQSVARYPSLFVDVADPHSVERAAASLSEPLDGLVDVAGIQIGAPLEAVGDGDIARQITVNLIATA